VSWEAERSFDRKLCQNICTENYQNLIIGFQVTVENVGDVFLRHSVQFHDNDDKLMLVITSTKIIRPKAKLLVVSIRQVAAYN